MADGGYDRRHMLVQLITGVTLVSTIYAAMMIVETPGVRMVTVFVLFASISTIGDLNASRRAWTRDWIIWKIGMNVIFALVGCLVAAPFILK